MFRLHGQRNVLKLLLIVLLSISGFGAFEGDAQESTPEPTEAPVQAYSIRPVGVGDSTFFDNVEMSPGESSSHEIRVLNFGQASVNLNIYKANANNPDNGGILAGKIDDEESASTRMIEFPAQQVTLAPGESVDLPFTISVPKDTLPGQYVATFVAGTVETRAFEGSDSIDYRISFIMPISILVPGELTYGFELGDPVIQQNKLTIPITNTGNYRVRPQGSLEIKNSRGEIVMTTDIALSSIYGGSSTNISVGLTSPLPDDQYSLTMSLADPDSGSEASLSDSAVTMVETEEAAVFTLGSISIVPNAEEIAFVSVDATIINNGQPLQTTNLSLEVMRDGEPVETFALAKNQLLLQGENVYDSVYVPESGVWEKGTYSFRLKLESVDPQSNQVIELLTVDLETEIVVP